MDNTYDLDGNVDPHVEAEAALAALRAAIGQGQETDHDQDNEDQSTLHLTEQHEQHGSAADFSNAILQDSLDSTLDSHSHQHQSSIFPDVEVEGGAGDLISAVSPITASQIQTESTDKIIEIFNQLVALKQSISDNVNNPRTLMNLMNDLQDMTETGRHEAEMVKAFLNHHKEVNNNATSQAINLGSSAPVSMPEYNALKTSYDELLASLPQELRNTKRALEIIESNVDELRGEGQRTPIDDKPGGRKKRSMKLEHLVHKMANRRLGVEYLVKDFESRGTKDLPDPSSHPPSIEESVHEIQEFRPDFRTDSTGPTVIPYLAQVIEDVVEAWSAGVDGLDKEVDRRKIKEAVEIYWARLTKRYDEQITRERGFVHKDELVRRKQNQYRRQQSLLARRVAAFDASPLNVCKLRSLYRTLLIIDFAHKTEERPGAKRAYSEDQWFAYRKAACGIKAAEAHEVVDHYWISSSVRALLSVLDTSAADQSSQVRRKGRPKAPAPTFHLPRDLWDRSTLPTLRFKDSQGLPVAGASGVILYRFHVDDQVIAENPEWAKGLYENPPIPDEDQSLPSLEAIMTIPLYSHLRPQIKAARMMAEVKKLDESEIRDILARPDSDFPERKNTDVDLISSQSIFSGRNNSAELGSPSEGFSMSLDSTDLPEGLSLDSFVGLTQNHPYIQKALSNLTNFIQNQPQGSDTPAGEIPHSVQFDDSSTSQSLVNADSNITKVANGSSAGSSKQARLMGKRSASELPGGAALPVPVRKRRKADDGTGGGIGVGVGVGVGVGIRVKAVEVDGRKGIVSSGTGLKDEDEIEDEDIGEMEIGVEKELTEDADFLLGL